MPNYSAYIAPLAAALALASCQAEGEHPGYEYAPQMYHSVPYEPLKQVTEVEAGKGLLDMVDNLEDGQGEFYNSLPLNKSLMNSHMTMRTPVEGTVRRGQPMPYRIPKDSMDFAAEVVKNPLTATYMSGGEAAKMDTTAYEALLGEGKQLYTIYCSPCHGTNGQGDGKVGQIYGGVPKYNTGRVAEVSEGHIFHTITHGKGRMGAHGSQIQQMDRWKIVMYVQTLQKQ